MQTKDVTKCPVCGSKDLGREWCAGSERKLHQKCYSCYDWVSKEKTPDSKPINNTKNVLTGQFHGWHYEIYDKYGYIYVSSAYYNTEDEAMVEMNKELKQGMDNKIAGPFTAVFWPPTVTVCGRVFLKPNSEN